MSDVRLPDVTEIGFTMVVDGQKHVVTFLRPDKIESLLDADESLAGFLCAIRDSDPTVADDVYDEPAATAERIEAEVLAIDIGTIVRLDAELAAALPGVFERAGATFETDSKQRAMQMTGASLGLLMRYAHELELSREDLVQLVERWVVQTNYTIRGAGDA